MTLPSVFGFGCHPVMSHIFLRTPITSTAKTLLFGFDLMSGISIFITTPR